MTELQNAIKTIEEHKVRAEQSLGATVTLQLDNASMGMDLESVRKQWSEDMDTLHAEVSPSLLIASIASIRCFTVFIPPDYLTSLPLSIFPLSGLI